MVEDTEVEAEIEAFSEHLKNIIDNKYGYNVTTDVCWIINERVGYSGRISISTTDHEHIALLDSRIIQKAITEFNSSYNVEHDEWTVDLTGGMKITVVVTESTEE